MLDRDVVRRSAGGGRVTAAGLPVTGAEKAARFALSLRTYFDPDTVRAEPRTVNGGPGTVISRDDRTCVAVGSFAVEDGRIVEVNVIANPAELGHISRPPGGWPRQGA